MQETSEKLSMPLAEAHDERSLPVPVPVAAPQPRVSGYTDPARRARHDHNQTVPAIAFLFAALSAIAAGAAAAGAGHGVLGRGLLGGVVLDQGLWRQHTTQLAQAA